MLKKDGILATEFLVLKDFDHTPKPSVIRAFRKGEKVVGLTRSAIKKGKDLEALEEVGSAKTYKSKPKTKGD